jgi:YegS/Rv2252/BmrU family lipid kinase
MRAWEADLEHLAMALSLGLTSGMLKFIVGGKTGAARSNAGRKGGDMRYKIIANPMAGRGYCLKSLPSIEQLLTGYGLDFDLVTTTWAGEAIELARQAVLDGYDVVVAAGGDGTFHEVVNGMISATEDSAWSGGDFVGDLGMLPTGSGCDFAWAAGVPQDLEGACAKLAADQRKIVDLGRVTVDNTEMRYFDNSVGIGFEGVVTIEVRRFKHLRGIALYLPAVLRSIFVSLKKARSIIEYEDDGESGWRQIKLDVLMADIYNGARGGGAFLIAPQAKLDDGKFDLCLLGNMSRFRMLQLIPSFMKGTHIHQKDVTTLRSKHVIVTSQDGLIAHTDGELLCTDAHRIECELLPKRIRLVC